MKDAIRIEWWIQNDGNYDQLGQIVEIIHNNNLRINDKPLIINNIETMFDLMGRKILNPASSGLSIIKNQNDKNDKNKYLFHFHGYQK
ncbi:hypothetical protein JW935_29135 [candidate division KSB1 bacterium]|nr:hypothetical protein [candidate division KSB1 bacterium]